MAKSDDDLKLEAIRLLDIIVGEFTSDPMSVQCFDLRIVEEAKTVATEARASGLLDTAWAARNG